MLFSLVNVFHRRFRLGFPWHSMVLETRARSVHLTLVEKVLLLRGSKASANKMSKQRRENEQAHGNNTSLSSTWHSKRKLLIWILNLIALIVTRMGQDICEAFFWLG
ncbi:hypothetical protein [Photobacterium kishitanii]|uniref:hypothetical protein n=1 Tax=Photobacterium kishitanii TaxID=318456 RepID=UPI0007F8E598|nr:hypothetical protein [Photobacterium kishitanii]OBU30160.1 hypothetical protein AYY23_21880 [Photobacterium kishitanii]